VVFILISITAFNAEQSINSRATGKFNYNISINKDDFKVEHYTIKRVDTSEPGRIVCTYDADTHTFEATTYNIKELKIDCRSIAAEKTPQILNLDYSQNKNAYKKYFIDHIKDFTVTANTDHDLILTFEDVPYPSSVSIDGKEQVEGTDYFYTNGDVTGGVAPADKESTVVIKFGITSSPVTAKFVTNKQDNHHLMNVNVEFDGTSSEGNVLDYLWDYGDGNYDSGDIVTHKYGVEGYYDVVLVVRDGNGEIDRTVQTITVFDVDGDDLPDEWESEYGVDDPNLDFDGDGLLNIDEYEQDTDPTDRDSDNDGATDKEEIDKNTDPNDPTSTPKVTTGGDDDDGDDGDGLFGLGKVAGIDTFILLLLIIIIIIILLAASMTKKKAKAIEEEELAEEEEEVVEEEVTEEMDEEGYECPECGSPISEDLPECDECGATLEWEDEDELEEEIEEEEPIPTKRSSKKSSAKEEDEEEEEDEEFECPTCGASVGEDDSVCPTCGEEFE
jgi:hypothetical protein